MSLDKIFVLGEGAASGAPQLVIAGSSMFVQSIFGERLIDSDIDLYCTWEAAPKVRKKLIDTCGMICAGNSESYGNGRDYSEVLGMVAGPLHPSSNKLRTTSYYVIQSTVTHHAYIQGDNSLDHVEQYAPLPAWTTSEAPLEVFGW